MDLTVWHLLLAALGLSFLIFVHELGHFLAAKKVGIRVETFCIGFQPTIFGYRARFFAFTRGGTEYAVGMVPLGGYVKMAGEQPGEQKTGAGDEFTSKTIGERALVLVAGSLMNLLFGFLFFVLAFTIGFETESSVVGSVVPGGPAWDAGIKPGDRIVAIEGEPKNDLLEVSMTVALRETGKPLAMQVRRPVPGGDPLTLDIDVTPRMNPLRGMPHIGISPSSSWEVGSVADDSIAARAGVKVGDRLRSVEFVGDELQYEISTELPPNVGWSRIDDFVAFEEYRSIVVTVERPSGQLERLPMNRGTPAVDENQTPGIGVALASRTVLAVQPQSEAASVFQPGWEIITLGDHPIFDLGIPNLTHVAKGKDEVTFETATGESGRVKVRDLISWLEHDVVIGPGRRQIETLTETSPLRSLGLQAGDHLLRVGETRVVHAASLDAFQPTQGSVEVEWWESVSRTTKRGRIDVQPNDQLDLGVRFDDRAVLGRVIPGSSAAAAGLRPGDVILQVNDQPVKQWSDLTREVTRSIPAPWWKLWWGKPSYEIRELQLQIDRNGTLVTVPCTPSQRRWPRLGIAPNSDKVLLKSGVLEACVQGPKRAYVWSLRVLLTLRSLFTGEVAASNLSGPVGILSVGTMASQSGLGYLIFVLALISVNLGIFNLLPFPILDGGHLTFLLVEKIKGSPVSERVQEWCFTIAFFLLIGLALFVTYNDLLRLFAR
ncbi:MAG: RIP metalloprotease RseP [Planctomycetota bacterium]